MLDDDAIRTLRAAVDHPSADLPTLPQTTLEQEDIADCLAMLSTKARANSPSIRSSAPLAMDSMLKDMDSERFELIGLLGVGGFGVVLGVFDRKVKQRRALKVLRPSLGSSGILSRRFLREIEIASRLRHKGIVEVHETGTIEGRPCILSTLIEGPSLSELLEKSGGKIEIPLAIELMIQVAEALQYSHERGVLHRDLKPGNILLQSSRPTETPTDDVHYTPMLTDFGLAKGLFDDTSNEQSLSAASELLGTPRYMSPEQATGRLSDVGICSDVYSLGAILYRCVTGQPPCSAATASEVLSRIQAGAISRPRTLNKAVSHDLENILLKSLALEPHSRYRSSADFAADLVCLQKGEPVSARRAGIFRRLRHWSVKRPGVAILSFCLILSGILSVSLSWQLYWSSKSEAIANEKMLRIAIQAVNDAYVEVAEKMLNNVPNSLNEQYRLHQRALDAHRKLAEDFRHNELSRYRLSVQHSYLGRSAARLGRFVESRHHHEECIRLLKDLIADDPLNVEYRYDVFFNRKCMADMMNALDAEKQKALEDVVREIVALRKMDATNPDYLDAEAASLFALGELLNHRKSKEAGRCLQDAIRISDQLTAEYPEKPLFGKYAILGRAELASWQLRFESPGSALKTLEEAKTYHASLSEQAKNSIISTALLRSLHFNELEAFLALNDWNNVVQAANRALETEAKIELHLPHADAYEIRRCQILLALVTAKRQINAPEMECRELLAKIQSSINQWNANIGSSEEASAVRKRFQELN